jgi:hypothetical protein
VKVVDDHLSMWQDELRGVKVRTPHVHANQGNLILMWQMVQVTGHGGFVPVAQEVNDPTIADVANHATGLVKQVNFVDAERGTCCALLWVGVFGGLSKDAPDSSLINSGIIGNAGEGSPERFPCNVEHQALCHQVMPIHIMKRLQKGLVAGSTLVAPSDHVDGCALSSDGDVHKQLGPGSVSVQLRA